MLAGEVLLDEERIHCEFGIHGVGDECHLRYLLSDYSMIDSLGGILTPREGTVVLDQYGWCVHGVDVVATETVNDYHTCLLLVLGHLRLHHTVGAGNAVVEIVGVGGADVGDVLAGLSPSRGIGAVGMNDAAQFGELPIQYEVGRGVARRSANRPPPCPRLSSHHIPHRKV